MTRATIGRPAAGFKGYFILVPGFAVFILALGVRATN